MNCHGDNKDKGKSHSHSPMKHMLHMLVCCGLPIVILGALPLITRFSPGASGFLGWLAPFICPVMMISMMFMMFRHNKKGSCCSDKEVYAENDKSLELNKSI